jgi:toxin ParE1/3/4
MNRYAISSRAKSDLDEIWTYIACNGSVESAERILSSIVSVFRLIAANPQIGLAKPQFGGDVRRFATGSYLIYYRRRRNTIQIVRVAHAARDQRRLFHR